MPGGVAIQRDVTLRRFPAALREIGDDAAAATFDFRLTLKDFSVQLAAWGKQSFDQSRAPDGSPWKPLKRARNRRRDRRARKRGGGSGQKPLRDTGVLMASMSATAGAKGGVRIFGQASLEQGTAVEYAAFHQQGTRHIPARPFAGLTAAMVDRLGDIAADRVARQIAGGRGRA